MAGKNGKGNGIMDKKEFAIEFGKTLKHLMKDKGFTQKNLAEHAGLKQEQISTYITGKVIPSFYIFYKLSTALECDMQDLIPKH